MATIGRARAGRWGGLPVVPVAVAAGLVLSGAMGIRQTFGLFLGPFSLETGIPVATTALAIALHNLVWGFAQPFAGAAADRYGAAPVVALGALVYAGGLVLTALAPAAPTLLLGLGLLVGIGISCTSFGVVLTAVGRASAPERRSAALGLASAGGSLGQVLLVPFAQSVTAVAGVSAGLLALAAIIVALAPLGVALDRAPRAGVPDGSSAAGKPVRGAPAGVAAPGLPAADDRLLHLALPSSLHSPRTFRGTSPSATCRRAWARPRWH
uniref:MFS transporter n=1 Tax=Methylobacterium sp. B34 TaxID=95563 RepID=UPI000347092B|nr:MFS transporter [Methylobacterium sp. B34]